MICQLEALTAAYCYQEKQQPYLRFYGINRFLCKCLRINTWASDLQFVCKYSDNLELSKVEIYSLLGKKIIVSNSKTIEIQNLPSGVYFTRIFTDKGMITKKVIKK